MGPAVCALPCLCHLLSLEPCECCVPSPAPSNPHMYLVSRGEQPAPSGWLLHGLAPCLPFQLSKHLPMAPWQGEAAASLLAVILLRSNGPRTPQTLPTDTTSAPPSGCWLLGDRALVFKHSVNCTGGAGSHTGFPVPPCQELPVLPVVWCPHSALSPQRAAWLDLAPSRSLNQC